MSAAVSIPQPVSITTERAKAFTTGAAPMCRNGRDEIDGEWAAAQLLAACNRIVSDAQTISNLETAVRQDDELIAEQERVIGLLVADCERLRRELDEAKGIIR